jgi:hypothetical protein
MTVFGKILTFVILVLALAQAALHVMFHIQQAKWAEAYQKADNNTKMAVAETESLRAEVERLKQERDTQVAKKQGEVDTLTGQLDQAQKGILEKEATIARLNKQVNLQGAQSQLDQANITRHKQEMDKMNEGLVSRDKQIRELLTSNNQYRDETVKAKIEANDYKGRNEQMVEMVKEMQQEIVALKTRSPGGGIGGPVASVPGAPSGTPGSAPSGAMTFKNPPSANIEGLITMTDPSTGMVTISVGSDAGVVKGNTLEIFRLNPPKYLGTLRILEAKPNEAVGKPVGKPLGQIMQGDRVASKILGG